MNRIIKLFYITMLIIYGTFMSGCSESHNSDSHDSDTNSVSQEAEHDHDAEHEDEAEHNHDAEHDQDAEHDNDAEHDHDAENDHDADHEDEAEHNHDAEHEADTEHEHEEGNALNHQEEETFSSGDEWEELIGLETTKAFLRPLELTISVPGRIVPNQNQIAVVSPFVESSINEIFVNIGDKVESNKMLLCLTSPEIGMLRAEYGKAKAELDIRKQNFNRQLKLFGEKIISRKSYQEAELEQKIAEIQYNYAVQKLLAIGIQNNEIDNPPTGRCDDVGSTIHIYAPISGIITSRNASIGQKVDSSKQLFEIINLDNVWLEADIFEKDLTKVQVGQTVKVKVSSYPQNIFIGKIFYIGNTLNSDTKTINILVNIKNKEGKLKPGMFAETNIVVGEKQSTLVVQKEAVLEDENLKIVFVREEEGYHRHVVTTGIESIEMVEILSGLAPGDIVVTKGNYQLKSKLKMSDLDPHAGHSH
ncbi:MAG: efflux RND transporter periplasmic adaptor subunit [Candidatus Latescibacteria bacterium]|jgi:membrane fusion protein, heavy metal efflux system|nr:efflux RND transporter periplasmic adaptor subunit [Candidatus Latescibacterota bacterium]